MRTKPHKGPFRGDTEIILLLSEESMISPGGGSGVTTTLHKTPSRRLMSLHTHATTTQHATLYL